MRGIRFRRGAARPFGPTLKAGCPATSARSHRVRRPRGFLSRPFVNSLRIPRIAATVFSSRTRIVRCCFCQGMMRVSARALSVSCPHCHKQISLEDLRIIGSHPGKTLATCGDVVVEQTARLNVALTARRVLVHGRVNGPVRGGEVVEIGPTGYVCGDIEAPKIVVRDGALIEGVCRMTGSRPTSSEDESEDAVDSAVATEGVDPVAESSESAVEDTGPRPLRRPGA